MAGRDILQYLIDNLGEDISRMIETEIKECDIRFKNLLVDTDKPVWGELVGKYHDKKRQFWYFGIIKNARGELLKDAMEDGFKLNVA